MKKKQTFKNLFFLFIALLTFQNSFTQQIPQQQVKVLGERKVLWVRGVDPNTDTWNVPDANIAQAEILFKDYISKISYGKATIADFDITPVYDFDVNTGPYKNTLNQLATADGFVISDYNIIFYNFDANLDIGGGATGSGNGNGIVNLPAAVVIGEQYKGIIHEGIHTFGLGHSEAIEADLEFFPGTNLGGADPYHFMGSEFDAGLLADVPAYFKYSVGWLDPNNMPVQEANPTSCNTFRLYEYAMTQNYVPSRNYLLQYSDKFIFSYLPEVFNSHITDFGNAGVLMQWQPAISPDVIRLIDTKPQSLATASANDIYAASADFRDAAMEVGDEILFGSDTIKILAIGGSGDERWVDIEICPCTISSGDSDGDGVCDSLDQCDGIDDSIDTDDDGIPDECDTCPNDPYNDNNFNDICDSIECLEGAKDNFDYDLSNNFLDVSDVAWDENENWSSPWNLQFSSLLTDPNSGVSSLSGALSNGIITGTNNHINFRHEASGNEKTILQRNLDIDFNSNSEYWISYLLEINSVSSSAELLVNGRKIGVGKVRNHAGIAIDGNKSNFVPVVQGNTYWVVSKYEVTTANTTVSVWVNPTPSNFDENLSDLSHTVTNTSIADFNKLQIIHETLNGTTNFGLDLINVSCLPPYQLFDCNLIGTPCDDGKDCTINDVYDENCNCYGTYADTDNDGICNAEDLETVNCTIGSPCDDGVDCTVNDTIDENCNCEGELLDTNNNFICDDIECPIDSYESFDYATNSNLQGDNGGLGFSNNWTNSSANQSLVSIINSSIEYEEFESQGGKTRVTLEGNGHASFTRNFNSDIRNGNNELWLSFLFNSPQLETSEFFVELENHSPIKVGKRRGNIFGISSNTIQQPTIAVNTAYWVVAQYIYEPGNVTANVWINPTESNFDINTPSGTKTINSSINSCSSITIKTSADLTDGIFEIDEFRVGCEPPYPLLRTNISCEDDRKVLPEITVNDVTTYNKNIFDLESGTSITISGKADQALFNATDPNNYTLTRLSDNLTLPDNYIINSFSAIDEGYYKITNQLGCESIIRLKMKQTLSVNDNDCLTSNCIDFENSFTIYPNPTTNNINIIYKKEADYEISIYDISGKLLKTDNNSTLITLDNFETGMYLLVIKNKETQAKLSKKIILTK